MFGTRLRKRRMGDRICKTKPRKNYVAVEKLSNVIVVACENAAPLGLPNLKFLNCRAENLLDYLPKHCVKEIALNFSCPFPKKRTPTDGLQAKTICSSTKNC